MKIDKKIMRYIKSIVIFILSMVTFVSCSEDKENIFNFVSYELSSSEIEVPVAGNTEKDFRIFSSITQNADKTFNIVLLETSTANPLAYILPNKVIIPANSNEGIFTLSMEDLDIDDGKTIEISLTSDDTNVYIGDDLTINASLLCPFEEVILEIQFDDYASDTGIEIKNSSNQVVYSFPAGAHQNGTSSLIEGICLTDGDYTFTITDDFGDGLSDPDSGSYKLSLAGESLISNTNFITAIETHSFTVQH
jgi:hypothetical protein